MKRIALLAPGAIPPWSEGRKIFVRDLAKCFKQRNVEVVLLDGTPIASPAIMILQAMRRLADELCTGRVDAVATFPYGTFTGLRGWANAWLLRRARKICAERGVPEMPVFYSCDGLGLEQIGSRFGPAMGVGRSSADLERLHLGIQHSPETWRPINPEVRRVLFLCGYQKPSRKSLRAVLFERGLVDLLDAGTSLAVHGIQLTIAIPFLRDSGMRGALSTEMQRRCPTLRVEMLAEVDSSILLLQHDVFAFPYRREHSIFIPTSLLEAMSIGIPILAADQPMYRALTVGSDGLPRCALHRIGNSEDLLVALEKLGNNYQSAIKTASTASVRVREEWTIAQAIEELSSALNLNGG